MKNPRKNYLIVIVEISILFILTFFIYAFDLDIKVQKIFYNADSSSVWFQKQNPFWQFGYHYGTLPAILLTFSALIGLILGWIKPKIKNYRHYFLLIILTLIIGPGLLVNAVFKDHWGRPRPRQIQEFGGKWEFKEVWQPSTPGSGKSFPCGHCSMGFFFITLYYCFKRKHKVAAYSSLTFSIALGMFIGLARISQGGHFPSDVLWSWGLTYLTSTIIYYFILKIPEKELESKNNQSGVILKKLTRTKRILVTLAVVVSSAIMIFTFLFSKPFYKQSSHKITADGAFQFLKLHLDINRGDIIIHSGSFEYPVQIQTIAQGFGFPTYQYQSTLSQQFKNDTLVANYFLNLGGLFNEIDVQTSISIDTTRIISQANHANSGTLIFKKKNSETVLLPGKN